MERGINNYVAYEIDFRSAVTDRDACIVPQAQAAATIEVTIAGSSAMWQTMALGAYNLACHRLRWWWRHWTSASNVVNLTDTRVTPDNVDAGTIWIVWNSTRHQGMVVQQGRLRRWRPLLLCSTPVHRKRYGCQSHG